MKILGIIIINNRQLIKIKNIYKRISIEITTHPNLFRVIVPNK